MIFIIFLLKNYIKKNKIFIYLKNINFNFIFTFFTLVKYIFIIYFNILLINPCIPYYISERDLIAHPTAQ